MSFQDRYKPQLISLHRPQSFTPNVPVDKTIKPWQLFRYPTPSSLSSSTRPILRSNTQLSYPDEEPWRKEVERDTGRVGRRGEGSADSDENSLRDGKGRNRGRGKMGRTALTERNGGEEGGSGGEYRGKKGGGPVLRAYPSHSILPSYGDPRQPPSHRSQASLSPDLPSVPRRVLVPSSLSSSRSTQLPTTLRRAPHPSSLDWQRDDSVTRRRKHIDTVVRSVLLGSQRLS